VSCGHILVVDDDPALRKLMAELLNAAGLEARSAGSGAEALASVRDERPDVVVLDVNLGETSGYAVCRELRDTFGGELGVMFVSGARTEAFDRVGGLLLGADDYLVKPFDTDEFVARVRVLTRRNGRSGTAPTPMPTETPLTPRETEILAMLASGYPQKAIADQLVLSPKTVSTHIQRVLTKLGVHSRAQAVAEAYRRGLADGDVEGHGGLDPFVPAA
jgi:DNA-binding NarL/FixJ family response regulator